MERTRNSWKGRFGLIDGIGGMNAVMKEEFGDDVKFVDFDAEKKGLLSFLPFIDAKTSMSGLHGDMVIEALDAVETRGYWTRYGL